MNFQDNLVILEGNIGAGKSYLLHEMTKCAPKAFSCLKEPVEQFCNLNNIYNPLKLGYESPFENVAITQLHITDVMQTHYMDAIKNQSLTVPLVSERSPYSAHIFNDTYFEMGFYNAFVHEYISNKIQTSITSLQLDADGPHKTIFVESTVETCLQRIQYRNREEEQKVAFMASFLRRLQDQYNAHIDKLQDKNKHVLRITNNSAPSFMTITKILDFCHEN